MDGFYRAELNIPLTESHVFSREAAEANQILPPPSGVRRRVLVSGGRRAFLGLMEGGRGDTERRGAGGSARSVAVFAAAVEERRGINDEEAAGTTCRGAKIYSQSGEVSPYHLLRGGERHNTRLPSSHLITHTHRR